MISKALKKCQGKDRENNDSEEYLNEEEKPKHTVRMQYRGESWMIVAGLHDT